MPLPTTKRELVERLREAHEKLDHEMDGLSAAAAREAGIEGDVSACDVLAYQLEWGRLLVGWDAAERSGEAPEMPAPGYRWNELGALARSFHRRHRRRSLAWLRRELAETVDEIAAMVESMSPEDLFDPGRRDWAGERWPVVKWVQVNTIAPYSSARTKVRRWKRDRS